MNKKPLRIVVLALAVMITFTAFSLQPKPKISSVQDTHKSGPVRIYYGKEPDSLPETMEVCGKVEQQTLPPHCGDVMFGGTLKIKPLNKIPGYSPEYVYVVVWCLTDSGTDFIGKTVRLHLTKSHDGENPCECELIQNGIDSKGIPFYCAGSLGASLDNVSCK